MAIPSENHFSQVRVELGRQLFFEKALSIDSSLSCASCHQTELYLTDGLTRSKGFEGQEVDRNSPSLFNVAWHPGFLREGGVPTLEMQVLVPVQEHREFNFNMVLLAERLRKDTAYTRMAREAYDRELDPFVIVRAISAFERTFISGNSPYDQFFFQGKKSLSKQALRGYALFHSDKLNCGKCHSGFNFSNYKALCNGLYEEYPDVGKFRLTEIETDRGCFKVPSLRNVEKTSPYMHDGSLTDLNQVIDHYAAGGKGHPNQSALIKGFEISEKEREALLAFLESLTDASPQIGASKE